MSTHRESVHAQFDPQAQAYLHSAVHARGPDLRHAEQLVARTLPATARVLDVGSGPGHLSMTLAPHVAEVVALDPSSAMLSALSEAAARAGLPPIATQVGSAEALSFEDGRFCLVATRYSAHHWTHLELGLAQMHRVLKAGGYLLLIDTEAHDNALVDTHLQTIELLRDRSHVRNRTAAQWRGLLADAGFEVLDEAHWPTRLEFASWVQRMRTPPQRVDVIRSLLDEAPQEVRSALGVEPDGSFTIRTGLFWARKAAG